MGGGDGMETGAGWSSEPQEATLFMEAFFAVMDGGRWGSEE